MRGISGKSWVFKVWAVIKQPTQWAPPHEPAQHEPGPTNSPRFKRSRLREASTAVMPDTARLVVRAASRIMPDRMLRGSGGAPPREPGP